ncbi:MAG: GNAT family N-acetyltransferase [Candidatus Methanomethylophilaceae archaeon]|nr:GNAT family N-acetyltransferase [Candidatus Methanomethylophilaceae archaeon]
MASGGDTVFDSLKNLLKGLSGEEEEEEESSSSKGTEERPRRPERGPGGRGGSRGKGDSDHGHRPPMPEGDWKRPEDVGSEGSSDRPPMPDFNSGDRPRHMPGEKDRLEDAGSDVSRKPRRKSVKERLEEISSDENDHRGSRTLGLATLCALLGGCEGGFKSAGHTCGFREPDQFPASFVRFHTRWGFSMTKGVSLVPLEDSDREQFIKDNQEAFRYGAMEEFGLRDCHFEEPGEIISRETIERSIDGGSAYRVLLDEAPVGGVIVSVSGDRGELEILFVSPANHSKGIGFEAWKAIERLYPDVRVWETCTPYFEKRNIHFYVNRCGFHITEFFHSRHRDPNCPEDDDEMFRFEKVMFRPGEASYAVPGLASSFCGQGRCQNQIYRHFGILAL